MIYPNQERVRRHKNLSKSIKQGGRWQAVQEKKKTEVKGSKRLTISFTVLHPIVLLLINLYWVST